MKRRPLSPECKARSGMGRAYSQDLRDRVIEATESGASARRAAARFEVSAATAIRWIGRVRDSGERSARRQGRRPGSKLDPHRDFLLAAVEAEPDSTLEELRRRLVEERGVRASISTIWTFLDGCGLPFKEKVRPTRRPGSPRCPEAA